MNPFEAIDNQAEADKTNPFEAIDNQAPQVAEATVVPLQEATQPFNISEMFDSYSSGAMNPKKMPYFEEFIKRRLTANPMSISSGTPYKPEEPEGKESETWKQVASQYGHDYLPVVGGMAGSVIGGAGAVIGGQLGPQIATPEELVTVPLGISAGGAAGFTLGEQSADVLDEMLGIVPKRNIEETVDLAKKNTIEGLEAEAIGLGISAPLAAIFKRMGPAVKNVFSPKSRVGSELSKMNSGADATNLARTGELQENIPGLGATYGMSTGNRDVVSLERGAIASAGKEGLGNVQTRAADIQTGNVAAIGKAVDDISTGKPEYFTDEVRSQVEAINEVIDRGASKDMQTLGTRLREAVSDAKSPVQAASQKMEGDIPKYSIDDLSSTNTSVKTIVEDPRVPPSTRKEIKSVKALMDDEIRKSGQNTHTLFGLRRELNKRITQAEATGDTWASSSLQSVKKGVEEDIAKLGEKARTGQLHVYKGKVVNPDDLADELENNLVKIAKSEQERSIDLNKMRNDLKEAGIPQEMFARHTGTSEDNFTEQITKLYKDRIGEVPLIAKPGTADSIGALKERNDILRKMLGEIEPGRDVASAINAYNQYTSSELFGRFKTDAIEAAKNGVLRPENVTGKFTTASGADDLIKALGNKQDAANFMWQHYESEIGKLGRDFTDKAATNWLRNNSKSLEKYGLLNQAEATISSMLGKKELDKILKSDINAVFDTIISGSKRTQTETMLPIIERVKGNPQAREGLNAAFRDYIKQKAVVPLAAGREGLGRVEKLFTDIEPTMDLLFNRRQKAQVKDIRDAVALTQRMTQGTPLGNSQTTELANQAKTRLIEGKKPSALARALVGGLSSSAGFAAGGFYGAATTTGAAYGLQEYLTKMGNERVRRYFAEAMFNPEFASTLIKASKKRVLSDEMKNLISSQASRAGVYATKAQTNQEEKQP